RTRRWLPRSAGGRPGPRAARCAVHGPRTACGTRAPDRRTGCSTRRRGEGPTPAGRRLGPAARRGSRGSVRGPREGPGGRDDAAEIVRDPGVAEDPGGGLVVQPAVRAEQPRLG